jgi:ribonucleoside-diphosphate reductase alpha chain
VIERLRLPAKRSTWTQSARLGGHRIHLSGSEYLDGRLGEVWIDLHKEGAALRGAYNALARVISFALQHGVPLAGIIRALAGIRCDPSGEVRGVEGITEATSIPDLVARVLTDTYPAEVSK